MKIGKILQSGKVEKEYVELGACFGTIFKDREAFEQKSTQICYMPELTDSDDVSEGYSYQDFIDLANGTFENLGVNGNAEVFARLLFDSCEWQSPETLIDEWNNSDEFEDYPQTYGIAL